MNVWTQAQMNINERTSTGASSAGEYWKIKQSSINNALILIKCFLCVCMCVRVLHTNTVLWWHHDICVTLIVVYLQKSRFNTLKNTSIACMNTNKHTIAAAPGCCIIIIAKTHH